MPMRNTAKFLTACAFALVWAIGPSQPDVRAQAGNAPAAPGQQQGAADQQQAAQPTFRVAVDLITTDMIARDSRTEQFIADLKPEEVEIYEDGVKQEIVSFVLTHGGRVYN